MCRRLCDKSSSTSSSSYIFNLKEKEATSVAVSNTNNSHLIDDKQKINKIIYFIFFSSIIIKICMCDVLCALTDH